ncbi:acyl-CoA dehydrogenase family protein [Streptomyces sp. NBC_01242]|uniref:acyl-CoA dehydrogenase family protein n=1 Tax=Streptomyces sp. NBC_01242 TaxID=2903795 RepID=UPI00224DA057|nr:MULTISPECIES: acyl-CoA dehydrogenase family protein [unclassified Streptomyces]MCX4800060.1 acyl-CoA dehydrogenase family protein [Streptomyces sp. NBC_01242]WSJ40752.1 acyl-CoA dehydrogenase family protein [Streptomyces sp. NBC_01321]
MILDLAWKTREVLSAYGRMPARGPVPAPLMTVISHHKTGDLVEFSWTSDQVDRYDRTLEAVARAFGTRARAADSFYLRKEWETLGELGLLGLCVPKQYGGQGLGALETARQVEAFGRACPDTGLVFAASAHLFACTVPILEFAEERLKERLLPALCSGRLIAGNAMTEDEAGSDVSRLTVTAREVEGGFLLSGEKTFVSNGPVADVYVTYATTDPEAGHLGVTGFVVERGATGLSVGDPFDKLGLLSCPAGTVRFDDCFVPDKQVLGVRGGGGAIFQHSMGWERACLFAGYLGLLDRLLDRCVEHARKRRQFGKRIGRFQAVAHRVVEMKLRTESARLLLYRACWEMDQQQASALSIALSKLAVSETAVAAALDAIQIFGGRGYLRDHGIEAFLRDTVPSTIFSGTSDIQRLLVAEELGL